MLPAVFVEVLNVKTTAHGEEVDRAADPTPRRCQRIHTNEPTNKHDGSQYLLAEVIIKSLLLQLVEVLAPHGTYY